MRSTAYIVLFLVVQLSFAQLVVKPISKKAAVNSDQAQLDVADAALPFWDDFSVSDETPDSVRVWGSDSSQQWDPNRSRGVFINSTLAINAPTYKVATFDGLDAEGDFYVSDNSAKGLTDRLASYPMDLSAYDLDDSIHLSFYWQGGGNVEIPEEGDSLILKLFNDQLDSLTFWKVEGGDQLDETTFEQVIVKIPQNFLTTDFRFQFEGYGDQDGPFDAWHLDWIYLNRGRDFTPLTEGYTEGGFSGELTSPFFPFYSLPISQFAANSSFVRNQTIETRSLNLLPASVGGFFSVTIDYSLTNTNDATSIVQDSRAYPLLFGERLDTTVVLGQFDQNFLFLDEQDFSSVLAFDSVVLRAELSMLEIADVEGDKFLDGSVVDLRVNDTVRQNYTLHDYYAFDDGTAEFAAGTNVRNAQVAVQFWVDQPDTLTHIDFQFPNISPILQSAPVLSLKVMRDLTETGLLRSQQVTVRDTTRNAFTRYELARPVVVSDTFFVGYQQFINDYIGIGFDRSNPEASQYIYENKEGDWIQNISLLGALMIRPVFKNGATLTLGITPEKEISIYPNPTNGLFRISEAYNKIQLLDLSGKVLLEEKNQSSHDVSKFEHGLYLLRIFQNDVQITKKIILR